MLTVATACDKKGAGTPSLASRPNVLFLVFGASEDPRAIPLAFLDSAGPHEMNLSDAEWRQFDSLYTRGGTSLALYLQGKEVGGASVQRGMWEGPQPLYTLKDCKLAIPQAAVKIAADVPPSNFVDFLATAQPLRMDTALANRPMGLSPVKVAPLARAVAAEVAKDAGIPAAALDSLDYRATVVNTGATASPTLVATYIDPSAGDDKEKGPLRHVLVVADEVNGKYVPTYRNVLANAGKKDPLERYIDRLDLTGDGVTEIVLEEWTLAGGSRPVVLQWKGGKWEQAWKGRDDWCLQKS